MKIITLDGKQYTVKYLQNKEKISVKLGTYVQEYPNFEGSEVFQNSSGSDKYTMTFAIHRTIFPSFHESIKKILINSEDAVNDATYGKLTNIVIEHPDWGSLKGKFINEISVNTSSMADVVYSAVFQINTDISESESNDIEQENQDAANEIDAETDTGELDEFDKPGLLKLAESLNELYDTIQNSAVIAAFNDLQSALNDAVLNYQKVMNAVKKILALPGSIIGGVRGKLDFFQKQAAAIRAIPRTTFNITRFNINCMAFNLRMTNRTPFVSKEAQRARAGIKTAPID